MRVLVFSGSAAGHRRVAGLKGFALHPVPIMAEVTVASAGDEDGRLANSVTSPLP
jgi:hypothetical protein